MSSSRLLFLVLLPSLPACAPDRPAAEPTIIERTPGQGGEIQSRDGLEAERLMWKNCRKGYLVLRTEPVVVGARTTPTPANTLLGLRDDTRTTYQTESRVRYRCVDPDQETPPPGSVLPARVTP